MSALHLESESSSAPIRLYVKGPVAEWRVSNTTASRNKNLTISVANNQVREMNIFTVGLLVKDQER